MPSNGNRLVREEPRRRPDLQLIECRSAVADEVARRILAGRRAEILFRLSAADHTALAEVEAVLGRYGF
jgi:hypothetical protein